MESIRSFKSMPQNKPIIRGRQPRLLSRRSAIRSVRSVVLIVSLFAGILSAAGSLHAQAGAQHAKAAAETPVENAGKGKQLFRKYGCYECHGSQGQIPSRWGPRLAPDPVPFEAFKFLVRQPVGNMPPFSVKVLSEQELADIYAFLKTVPHPPSAKTIPLLK